MLLAKSKLCKFKYYKVDTLYILFFTNKWQKGFNNIIQVWIKFKNTDFKYTVVIKY